MNGSSSSSPRNRHYPNHLLNRNHSTTPSMSMSMLSAESGSVAAGAGVSSSSSSSSSYFLLGGQYFPGKDRPQPLHHKRRLRNQHNFTLKPWFPSWSLIKRKLKIFLLWGGGETPTTNKKIKRSHPQQANTLLLLLLLRRRRRSAAVVACIMIVVVVYFVLIRYYLGYDFGGRRPPPPPPPSLPTFFSSSSSSVYDRLDKIIILFRQHEAQQNQQLRHERRTAVWEQIVHDWLHRNDHDHHDHDHEDSQQQTQAHTKPKPKQTLVVRKMEEELEEETRDDDEATDVNHHHRRRRRIPITLRTMDQHQGHSCGRNGIHTNNRVLPHVASAVQTTLVIQASVDRLWILNETCRRWSDPMVAVVGIHSPTTTNSSDPNNHASSNKYNYNYNNNNGQQQSLAAAAASSDSTITFWTDLFRAHCPQLQLIFHPIPADPVVYPINFLRNLALDAVTTSHVLTMDVDFVPSMQLADTIRNAILQIQFQEDRDRTFALVVPAFERVLAPYEHNCDTMVDCQQFLRRNASFLPATFPELYQCATTPVVAKAVADHKNNDDGHNDARTKMMCQVFQHDNNLPGHASTRTSEWLEQHWYADDAEEPPVEDRMDIDAPHYENARVKVKDAHHDHRHPRSLRKISCFNSLRYEPYVVIPWCGTNSASPHLNNHTPATMLRASAAAVPSPTQIPPSPSLPLSPYYDERFYGYGKNKIQYIQHLRLLAYPFYVLPAGFIVHHPHPDSHAKLDWNAHQSSLHQDMDRLYPTFLRELLQQLREQEEEEQQQQQSATTLQQQLTLPGPRRPGPGPVVALCPHKIDTI